MILPFPTAGLLARFRGSATDQAPGNIEPRSAGEIAAWLVRAALAIYLIPAFLVVVVVGLAGLLLLGLHRGLSVLLGLADEG